MLNLCDIGTIRPLLQRHGFHFSKALGQNFIVDSSVCPRIAELGGVSPEVGVIEIGAGIGVLTRELASRAKKVVVIELDDRLLPILEETLSDFDNIKVIHADVLEVDLPQLIADEFPGMHVTICANLPYYITSPILMKLLESRLAVDSITVMVQKEAAQRICAPEGSRDTGAITFAVRYYSEPTVLFHVSRDCFLPSPTVDSSVIRLDVRKTSAIPIDDEAMLFRVIRGAFSQRRKTMANSLSSALSLDKASIQQAMEQAGVSSGSRPEQLTLDQFASIAHCLRAGQ